MYENRETWLVCRELPRQNTLCKSPGERKNSLQIFLKDKFFKGPLWQNHFFTLFFFRETFITVLFSLQNSCLLSLQISWTSFGSSPQGPRQRSQQCLHLLIFLPPCQHFGGVFPGSLCSRSPWPWLPFSKVLGSSVAHSLCYLIWPALLFSIPSGTLVSLPDSALPHSICLYSEPFVIPLF